MPPHPHPDHWKTFFAVVIAITAPIVFQAALLLVWRRRLSPERREFVWPWEQWGLLLLNPTASLVTLAFAIVTRKRRAHSGWPWVVDLLKAIAIGVFWTILMLVLVEL